MAFWGNLTSGARLAWDYVGFVREPLTIEQSVQLVRERLARREEYFLTNLERVVFNNPKSPYRRLFAYAGCELGTCSTRCNSTDWKGRCGGSKRRGYT